MAGALGSQLGGGFALTNEAVSLMSPRPARLLVVDNDDLFRQSTSTLLRLLGFDCDEAESTATARGLLAQTNYDLILMDRCMEGNFSLEGAREIAALSQAPIIILTGFPTIDSAIEAVDQQVAGYVVKPIDAASLRQRIDHVLAARGERSGHATPGRSAGRRANGAGDAIARTIELRAVLTPRETDIVRELLEGYRVSTISRRLGISANTVRRHLKNIFIKLEVSSQAALLEKLKP